MKVKELIEKLQQFNPESEVKLLDADMCQHDVEYREPNIWTPAQVSPGEDRFKPPVIL